MKLCAVCKKPTARPIATFNNGRIAVCQETCKGTFLRQEEREGRHPQEDGKTALQLAPAPESAKESLAALIAEAARIL